MSQVKRMLVPTDFSPTSDIAFNYAIDVAVKQGCSIHLLHALDDRGFVAAYPDGFLVELPGRRLELTAEANRRLAEMASECEAANVPATTEVAVGRPADLIVARATARGTDLIVMGTHGRGVLAHAVLGSVAERVVRLAPCAVLTVRDTSLLAHTVAAEAATRRQRHVQPGA